MGYLTPSQQKILVKYNMMPRDVGILEILATEEQSFGQLDEKLGKKFGRASITISLHYLGENGLVAGPDPKSKLYGITDEGRKKIEEIAKNN